MRRLPILRDPKHGGCAVCSRCFIRWARYKDGDKFYCGHCIKAIKKDK